MTDEQIKQNAEEYIEQKFPTNRLWERKNEYDAFITGAHSRDEEILKLRNPWISVEDRLPEKVNKFLSDEVLVRYLRGGKEYTFVTHYDYEYQTWNIPNVTHWMPIPQLPKGGAL